MLSRWAVIVVVLSAGIYLSLKANIEYYSFFHGKDSVQIRKEFIDRGGQYQVEFKVEDGDIVFDFGGIEKHYTFTLENNSVSKNTFIF